MLTSTTSQLEEVLPSSVHVPTPSNADPPTVLCFVLRRRQSKAQNVTLRTEHERVVGQLKRTATDTRLRLEKELAVMTTKAEQAAETAKR